MAGKHILHNISGLGNAVKKRTVLAAAAASAAAVLSGAYAAYKYVFHFIDKQEDAAAGIPRGEQYDEVHDKMYALVREMQKIPYEQVFITAKDGIRLAGKYYHVRDGAPLQIQCHGYHGNGFRDFCGGNKLARESGHNTLVIDQRAHGMSEGHTITFGIMERYDCQSWIEYAIERFGTETPIFLAGVSMGAATVLMVSELELPENVIGIIADCPYSSPTSIIRKVGKDRKLPTKLIYPFIRAGALIFGRFHVTRSSAVEAVKHTKIPVLLIHGEDDRFVPCDMTREIYEACVSEKTMVTVPGAGHGLSYLVDEEKYTNAVSEFMEKQLEAFRVLLLEKRTEDV